MILVPEVNDVVTIVKREGLTRTVYYDRRVVSVNPDRSFSISVGGNLVACIPADVISYRL